MEGGLVREARGMALVASDGILGAAGDVMDVRVAEMLRGVAEAGLTGLQRR